MTMKTKLTDALAELSNVWRQQIEIDPTDPYDDGYSTAKHECYESLIDVIREHDSAEIAGALRDAERYRWLRAAHGSMDFGFWHVCDFAGCIIGQRPEELDTAIDSAMQQGGGGE